jgi:hypothetical protein
MIDTIVAVPDENGIYNATPHNHGDTILVHGSCRMIPYINYINESTQKYKILYLRAYGQDPTKWENNQVLQRILKSVKIFIYEHSQNIGALNTDQSQPQNIFQIGLQPELSIQIPAFNDIFVLFNDYFDQAAKDYTTSLIGPHDPSCLSDHQIRTIYLDGEQQIQKFLRNCHNTSFPEFAEYFLNNYLSTRLFCSFNHTHRNYSYKVWELLNNRFLHVPQLPHLASLSFYENTQTKLHPYDHIHRTFTWKPEPEESSSN